MTTVHISESDLARNLHSVLDRVQRGVEVVIEQDHRPIAVLRSPLRGGRPIAEILREAKLRNSTVTLDEGFAEDLETIIESHQKPWTPPSWD